MTSIQFRKIYITATASYQCRTRFIVLVILCTNMLMNTFFQNALTTNNHTWILPSAESLIISPPLSTKDYSDLASLLVQTFDEPSASSKKMTKLDQISWSLYDKYVTEQYTYRQYVQTAKKMKGNKYALYLAKEYNPGEENDDSRPFYEVVGMIELGMVLQPMEIMQKTNDNTTIGDGETIGLRPRPTVGVLCVKPSHQNKGIGKALLMKCEEEVSGVWNETHMFIEVEPNNESARQFFKLCDYESCIDKDGNDMIHSAKVSRRRKIEERPHLVLSKRFSSKQD